MDKLIDWQECRDIVEDEMYERYVFKNICPWDKEYYNLKYNGEDFVPDKADKTRGNLTKCVAVDPKTRASRNRWLSGMADRELAYRRSLLKTTGLYGQKATSGWGVMAMAIAKGTYDCLSTSDQKRLVSKSELLSSKLGVIDSQPNTSRDVMSRLINTMTDSRIDDRLYNGTAPLFKTRYNKLYYLRTQGRYEFCCTLLSNTLVRMALNLRLDPIEDDVNHVARYTGVWCNVLGHSYESFARTVEVVNASLEPDDKIVLKIGKDQIKNEFRNDDNVVNLLP